MSQILALFTVSLRQALPKKRTLLLVLLQLVPALIYLATTTNRTETYSLELGVQIGASVYFALVLPVVSIVLAAGVLGSERRDQTLSFIALRPLSRVSITIAKVAAAFIGASVINAVGAVALASAHAILFGDTQLLMGFVIGSLVATIAYVGIFVPLGFLTDRSVIIGMAYLLVFENGIVAALPGLASMSPWRLGLSTFGALTPNAAIYAVDLVGNLELSVTKSVSAAALFLAVGIASTTLLLRTRDLA